MKAYLKNLSDEISIIAVNLADHFAKPLYDFTNAKSYSEYIEILKEILNWSHEFYEHYHHQLNTWESFERSQENTYKAVNRNEFLIAWGEDRLKRFIDEQSSKCANRQMGK